VASCGSKPQETAAVETPAPAPVAAAAVEPVKVLITLPPGAAAPTDFAANVAALRAAGADVLLLKAQPAAEPGGFESLAIVTFPSETEFDAWSSDGAGKLGAAFKVRRADVLAHDGDPGTPAPTSFYVVNHYESLITPEGYRDYTQKYVVPNMANQKSTGAMIAYTMYIERESEGVKPHAVLVKEYLSPAEQVRAESAKEKYKEEVLLKQAEWSEIHAKKATLRNDLTETFASAVQ
jgi:hypothetical protein